MTTAERVILFPCAGDTLIGILAMPEVPRDVGVIILVGGPQYRVGGHRQNVQLARRLSEAGYVTLRFDYRGTGDSTGEQRNYECVSDDIGAAIAALKQQVAQLKGVVLWGLCGGVSAALIYCHEARDSRVIGLCLMNPWVRTEATLALTQVKYYYWQRIVQREFWLKLLRGRVARSALKDLWQNLRLAIGTMFSTEYAIDATELTFQLRMARAWHAYQGRILLLLSGQDYTAKEFLEYVKQHPDWAGALEHPMVQRCDLPEADHTCTEPAQQTEMENVIISWLKTFSGSISIDRVLTAGVHETS